MDVKQLIQKNAILVAVVAFLAGLLLGWMVLGWVVAPVKYVDAGPENLSDFFKVQYVQLVADSLVVSGDVATAQRRIGYLGDGAPAAINLALQNTSGADNFRVSQLATVLAIRPSADQPSGGGTTGGLAGFVRLALPICAAVLLLVVVAGGALFFLQSRRAGGPPRPGPTRAAPSSPAQIGAEMAQSGFVTQPGEEPVSEFKTTYILGNDLYDESFSIDDQQGDFLGECGVGIGETIGVGDPKKVAAFEVWLFDKNDIRTVTKVLMSEHAFRDEALKSRLAAKGEPVLARSGEVIRMETATLRVEARVVDLQYGSGALPPNSFFQQLTLEIGAWKKPM